MEEHYGEGAWKKGNRARRETGRKERGNGNREHPVRTRKLECKETARELRRQRDFTWVIEARKHRGTKSFGKMRIGPLRQRDREVDQIRREAEGKGHMAGSVFGVKRKKDFHFWTENSWLSGLSTPESNLLVVIHLN